MEESAGHQVPASVSVSVCNGVTAWKLPSVEKVEKRKVFIGKTEGGQELLHTGK